jgi:hypothetical protein
MSSILCPRCGSPVQLRRFFSPANKPFCTRCSWNLERAEVALASKTTALKLIPLALAVLGIFFAAMAEKIKSPAFLIFPLFFGLVALIPVWSYFSTRKSIAAAKFSVNPDLAQAQPPLDASLQMLQSLPRPRRVRFRFRGAFAAFAILLGFVLVFVGLIAATANKRPGPSAGNLAPLLPVSIIVLTFAIVLAVLILREKRKLPLLRDGELAFGRVVGQRLVQQGKSSYSQIEYEFQTNTGQQIRGACRDLTSAVFEDMTIAVFYDPLEPSRNITPCGTYLAIASSAF